MNADRERWIDSWKGMLILLVVLGHAVGMTACFARGTAYAVLVYLYRFIYFFHMPAFFMLVGVISGLSEGTWAKTEGKDGLNLAFIARKFKRLMIPYFFWGVVSIVIFLTTMSLTSGMRGYGGQNWGASFNFPWWRPFVSLLHGGFWPNGEGFRYNYALWFLPCMFLVLLSRKAIQGFNPKSNNLKSNNLTISSLLLLCLTLGGALRIYVGCLPWCLDRVPRFLAFVLLGELIARCRWPVGGIGRISGLLVGWAIFAAGVVVFPDFRATYVSWTWYFAEAGMAALGCILSMSVARMVDCRFLASLGVASLGIMLTHKFPIVALQSAVAKCGGVEVDSVALGLLASLGVTAVATALAWGVARVMPQGVGGRGRK